MKDSDLNQQELINLIQKGDKKAFTKVYNHYNKMLYTLAMRYLKDDAMAKDAVQYTFTKLWEIHKKNHINCSLKNYLYTITRNHILNQIRQNNTAIINNYQWAQNKEKVEVDSSQTIEEEETIKAFYSAIEKLPKQKKEICLLKIKEQLTNKEIADILNVSLSTVKINFIQSKELLKRQLKKALIIVLFFNLF